MTNVISFPQTVLAMKTASEQALSAPPGRSLSCPTQMTACMFAIPILFWSTLLLASRGPSNG